MMGDALSLLFAALRAQYGMAEARRRLELALDAMKLPRWHMHLIMLP